MVSLSAPLWLLGLGLLPLLWQLHRFRDGGRRLTVSALFLWRNAAQSDDAGPVLARPDPQWRVRAALLLCLLLALAGPRWRSQRPPLVVWLDDSLSLFTQEAGRSRLVAGVDRLLSALPASGAATITIRSLNDPAKTLALDLEPPDRWRSTLLAGWREPAAAARLPAPVELDRRSEHWLVSDGARPELRDWLRLAPVTRVIQIGRTTENVGLIALAARPSLLDGTELQTLVAVANMGEQPAERTLEIQVDERMVWRQTVTLAPNQIIRLQRAAPQGKTLQARLTPADALPLDDDLQVTPPTPVAWRQLGDCDPPLLAALAAHPRLRRVETDADLTVACGSPPPVEGPLLLFHSSRNSRSVQGVPWWSPAAGALRQVALAPDWLARTPAPPQPTATEAVLTAGDVPLIVRDPRPGRLIEVLLAMDTPGWSDRPEYPWLLAGLLDLALQRELLDAIAASQRPPQASRIVPAPLAPAQEGGAVLTAADWRDSTPAWIGLGALLLLLDLWRQREVRQRR